MARTLRETIRELNRTAEQPETAAKLRILLNTMQLGGLKVDGVPVIFDYADTRDFFLSADPTIDATRFEELMQLADSAP